jgi:xylan 1,4-beta-xylosidase
MFSRVRSARVVLPFIVWAVCAGIAQAQAPLPREQVLAAMKRATTFMVEKVAHRGGYVWNYLPDMTRRWGELEARPTMIWIQPPGTPSMGHLFLDAYHATGDAYYYQAAEQVAAALAAAQHPSGGWNYLHDFAGESSLRQWYGTVGKNAWRLEEFQHYYGNATFDDAGTAESAKFFLRLYLEQKDPKYKAPLDKAIRFVIDSQYPNGLWPQRYPKAPPSNLHGLPDYTAYPTFNDDVAGENMDFLLLCYQALGDQSLLPPITRGMDSFLITQMPAPQAGWGLQHTPDLQPAGARTYEPKALVTHTTAGNVALLLRFHRLTGDAKYLARIPEALDWLERLRLPAGIAPAGRTHPTFVELGTNEPLYVHRTGSNVVNGRYFVDKNSRGTIVHYSSFRAVDVAGLRKQYEAAKALTPDAAARTSPLKLPPGSVPLPKYHTVGDAGDAARAVSALNVEGYWPAPLGYNSNPFTRDGSKTVPSGDFSQTYVGDVTDTSPFPDPKLTGISIDAYVRNMGILIRALDAPPAATRSVTWRFDNTTRLGTDAVQAIGAPSVVSTEIGAALQFNGTTDGVLIERNPIAGVKAFTIEVLLSPDADGPEEQRFLHIQENSSENRALVELRLRGGRWALDSYLRHGDAQRTLLDPTKTHPSTSWHVTTTTFDGAVMRHYVDGVEQGSGEVAFQPLAAGRTSVGVRQNRVSWFKGRIHTVRVSSSVLPPSQFLTVPSRVIALWPEGVPGRKPTGGAEQTQDGAVSNVHEPSLTYFAPASGKATGTAMILCAGGSYARLALDNEMAGLTPRLTARGIAVFVLKYRLSEYGHPAPLRDVLRGIRTVRSRATEFGVRENRIGLFGASAGGHLAASAAAWFDAPEGQTGAAIDAVSARPDFVSLLYPVVTMRAPHAHAASRRNLLGESPATSAVDRLSIELQARSDMPPFFVVHTAEDLSVPIENSYALVQALRAKGVAVESHFYENGAHGFGVSAAAGAASAWPDRLTEWLAARGFIASPAPATTWARGVEGQRQADLGDGTFLNPILAGDHPDPSILRDGDDYYMTFSSFDAYPGLVIWHSRDLVNWQPIGPALFKNVGSVWAPDLVKHNGRYYIYFPGIAPYRSNYVVWADNIRGPWSEPIDLKITRIDPGHAVGPDGRRYLFLSAGELVPLAADGLSTTGPAKKIYDGWKYPDDWVVETFAQEGPKILRRGDYYYMVLAEGGTAGPATGHMIVAARSRSIDGPWENSPYNPILRTQSSAERWWSKGHGTLVEDRAGKWWMVYHAYENGYYTLGRQTLLEPIEWTADGWFRTAGADPAAPIAKPAGEAGPHGFAFSDDFSGNRMGLQWSFYAGDEDDRSRYRYENGALVLKAKGMSPATASPLWFVAGDHAYEIEVEIDADATASAGVLVFYSRKLYAGLGVSAKNLLLHTYGMDRVSAKPPHLSQRVHLRLRNDRHIVTLDYSADGKTWERFDRAIEVSGYHHNVAYDFLSLRPALYAAGQGEVRFRNFKYRALP